MTMHEPPSLAVAAGSPKQFFGSSQDGGSLSCSRRTIEEQIGELKLQNQDEEEEIKVKIVITYSGNVSLY